jgi:hypothetical protein
MQNTVNWGLIFLGVAILLFGWSWLDGMWDQQQESSQQQPEPTTNGRATQGEPAPAPA